jgi:hypothetical protein
MNRRASDESPKTQTPRTKAKVEKGKQKALDTAREAADIGKEQLQSGTGRAAEGVGDFAEAVGSAASRLGELEHEGLADYANRISSYLSDMSSRLREKNVDELADDVRRLAERNPALFVLGSVAVGLGLSRFAKASGESRDRQSLEGVGDPTEWRGTNEPSMTMTDYTSRDRGADDRAADRPMTPDSSGGGGL